MDRPYVVRERQNGIWVELGELTLSDEMVAYFEAANRNTTKILQLQGLEKDKE